MNRTQFLELFEAGLSDCGIDAETRAPFVLHAKQKIDSVDDDVFTARGYTAVDAHKLASAVATEGNDATDEFFKLISEPMLELPEQNSDELELNITDEDIELPAEDAVFEPDQFFYEFASIDEEPEFVSSVIDGSAEIVSGTQAFDANEDEFKIDEKKLRKIDKSRRSVAVDRNVKGTPLFWILFIVTLPITLPLFAAIWACVGLIYAAIAAIMVSFVIGMIALVAVGTALALVGLIFGIYKSFSLMPIGLFEIGLAISIGGVTMLMAILVYNLVVRLMPKLFPFVKKLAIFVWTKISDLYYLCKKECGNK